MKVKVNLERFCERNFNSNFVPEAIARGIFVLIRNICTYMHEYNSRFMALQVMAQ